MQPSVKMQKLACAKYIELEKSGWSGLCRTLQQRFMP